MKCKMGWPIPHGVTAKDRSILEINADDVTVTSARHEHALTIRCKQRIVGTGSNVYGLHVVTSGARPNDRGRARSAARHTDDSVVGHGRKLRSARSGPDVPHRQVRARDREEGISTGICHEDPLFGFIEGQVGRFLRYLGNLNNSTRERVESGQTFGAFTRPDTGGSYDRNVMETGYRALPG